jgi:hypothetical protein
MTRVNLVLLLLLFGSPGLLPAADDKPADAAPRKPFEAPTVADADAFLRLQMDARWAKPERRKWRIDYRPIKAMESRSSWHIEGTHWWVRLFPNHHKLDELDRTKVYEIDAVALDQAYGTINFYVYHRPQPVKDNSP